MEDQELNVNIADGMEVEQREKIGADVVAWFRRDRDARNADGWDDTRAEHLRLSLVKPPLGRQKPWEDSADVCIPIMASACQQMSARAYSATTGNPDGSMMAALPMEPGDVDRARKVSRYVNWQIRGESPDYEAEWDLSLDAWPKEGCFFRYVTWDFERETIDVCFVSAKDVFIPPRTKKLRDARRVTWRRYEHPDHIQEQAYNGFYANAEGLDVGHDQDEDLQTREAREHSGEGKAIAAEDQDLQILECHCRLVLDGDDERSPGHYTAWVEESTGTLLRLVNRTIQISDKEHVIRHWVKFGFIPNPYSFYDYGYGHILAELNKIGNAIFNQYIDAGALANNPFVFYGRGAGLKGRRIRIRPGEGVSVGDISQILMAKFPGLDQHLPQLLGIVQAFAQELTSNTDEIQGKSPKGVREPTVGGTMARIEQGLTAFGVSTKRLLRSYREELQLIVKFNELFAPQHKQFRVLGITKGEPFDEITREDFGGNFDIIPTGHPMFASPQQRRAEAGEVMQAVSTHPLVVGNPEAGTPPNVPVLLASLRAYLETYEQSDIIRALPEPEPPHLSPEAENASLMQGQYVEPKEDDEHERHLVKHAEIMESPAFAEIPASRREMFMLHVKEHRVANAVRAQAAKDAEAMGSGAEIGGPIAPEPAPEFGAPAQ